MCGFNELDREQKVIRAQEILSTAELKQAICHQILGTTFKDIERAMRAIIDERQLTTEQQEELEIRQTMPEKYEPEFDPTFEFKLNKKAADPKKGSGYGTYTREQVAELLAASNAPCLPPPVREPIEYPTYSREQVQELMRQHYEYLEEEKRRNEERAKWGSQKTTELDQKTVSTKKPSISTKD